MNNLDHPNFAKWNSLPEAMIIEFNRLMKEGELAYINVYTNDLADLEKQWEAYLGMTKPFRRRSDWLTLEYIGLTNETIYNTLKSLLIGDNLDRSDLVTPDQMLSEAAYVPVSQQIDYGLVLSNIVGAPYFFDLKKEAEEWMRDTGFVLIIPSTSPNGYNEYTERDIDSLWDAYNMMIKRHRRMADWKSLELFDLTVPQIYTYLKSIYLRNPPKEVTPEDIIEETPFNYSGFLRRYATEVLAECSAQEFGEGISRMMRPSDNFTEAIISNIVTNAIDNYETNNSLNVNIDYTDLPAFSPQEMIDMGIFMHAPEDNFYGVTGDKLLPGTEMLEWFELYEAVFYGMPISDRYEELNRKRIMALETIYAKYPYYKNRSNSLNQAIIECGWNPAIEFSPQVRVLVDNNLRKRIQNQFGGSKLIDLEGFRINESVNQTISEKSTVLPVEVPELDYLPIFLVFEEGKTTFSELIKHTTHGIYSHAAIAFDHKLHRIYSYGIEGSVNGIKGGLVIEDIKDKEPDKHLAVFCTFVDKITYDKIKTNVEYFANNARNTAYSYANVLSIAFRIPLERDNKMICSQFVDRMLKLGGIDITKKRSSLVDPNYLRKATQQYKHIYKLFEGKNKSYNPALVEKRLKANYAPYTTYISPSIIESVCYYNDSLEHLKSLYTESVGTPLEFLFERVYKDCYAPKIIKISEKDDDCMSLSGNATIDKGYELIREFNSASEQARPRIVRDMRQMSQTISREMVYVIRPKIYDSLKECKTALDEVLINVNK